MHDYYSGLDESSFQVTADFEINGIPPGANLASKFKQTHRGVWELQLNQPITNLPGGTLDVSIKDQQGNLNQVVRKFRIGDRD